MTEQNALVWEGGTVVGVEPVVDMGLTIVESPKDFGDSADMVFDASGQSVVAGELLPWLPVAGTAVIVGANKPGRHGLDLLSVVVAAFTNIGIRICQRGDTDVAIDLVTTGRLDAHRLISKIFPLNEAVAALYSLRRSEGMRVLIQPGPIRSA